MNGNHELYSILLLIVVYNIYSCVNPFSCIYMINSINCDNYLEKKLLGTYYNIM